MHLSKMGKHLHRYDRHEEPLLHDRRGFHRHDRHRGHATPLQEMEANAYIHI